MGEVLHSQDRTWGMLCHLSALAGYLLPGGNFLGPLIVWLLKKEESAFVDHHGRESLNFQISVTLYLVVAAVLSCAVIGFVLLPVIALAALVLTIVASISASGGDEYQYPLTIRLL
jgi:uncharacterized Tic20 family protein